MKISKNAMAVATVAALSAVLSNVNVAQAQSGTEAGDWLVRARAIDVAPDASSNSTLKSAVDPGVTNAFAAEVDFTYFALKNVALELILATTNHDITLPGQTAPFGTVGVLPPTLTAQYHFLPERAFRPYVGAGVNFTWFYAVKLPTGVSIDHSSFGPALQAGFDYQLNDKVFINVDIKKIWISTDVEASGTKLGTLDIDPLVIGVGAGTKF